MKKENPSCKTCHMRQKTVFCDIGHKHLEELDATKTTNHYMPHQIIFYAGNRPSGLYCINSGKIKIYRSNENGQQKIVRLVGPGDVMGYRSLLVDELYTATAETVEEATICFIDKKTFFDLLETHPKTALNVMKVLAIDLRHAEEHSTNLVYKNIRERLAELLLLFEKRYGKESDRGIELDITLTREELAQLVGTTQESVIRLISEFKQDGLLHVEGKKIILLDIKKITTTANLVD